LWKLNSLEELLTQGCEWLQGYLLDDDNKKNVDIPHVCSETLPGASKANNIHH